MVNTEGLPLFEGYYRNPEAEAERTRAAGSGRVISPTAARMAGILRRPRK